MRSQDSCKFMPSTEAVVPVHPDAPIAQGGDDTKVIPLERSAAGHQLLSLTDDLFQHAHTSKSRMPSLKLHLGTAPPP